MMLLTALSKPGPEFIIYTIHVHLYTIYMYLYFVYSIVSVGIQVEAQTGTPLSVMVSAAKETQTTQSYCGPSETGSIFMGMSFRIYFHSPLRRRRILVLKSLKYYRYRSAP